MLSVPDDTFAIFWKSDFRRFWGGWKLDTEVIEPIYSVDMIRLKSRIYKDKLKSFMSRYNIDPKGEHWEKYKFSCYRNNWRITDTNSDDEECSFYVASNHNMEKGNQHKTGVVIEFNPNNCNGADELDRVLNMFSLSLPIVKSIDIAVDFHKVNINWLTINKGNKRRLNTIDIGGDDKTYYVGERGKNLQVKVYNKARERRKKKKGYQVLYDDWTRYEITIKPDITVDKIKDFKIDKEIPNITYICENEFKGLNSTDRFILKAIKKGVGTLNELPRRRKRKLRSYVEKEYKQLVKPYLIENKLKEYVKKISRNYHFLDEKYYRSAHYQK